GITLALVPALSVGRANLALRTIRVVGALSLGLELADMERAVARDASERRRAVPRALARHVAAAECANEGRGAIRVGEAPLRQIGVRRLVARAGAREQDDERPNEKDTHCVHRAHLYIVPRLYGPQPLAFAVSTLTVRMPFSSPPTLGISEAAGALGQ